jgi:hypothetical protein
LCFGSVLAGFFSPFGGHSRRFRGSKFVLSLSPRLPRFLGVHFCLNNRAALSTAITAVIELYFLAHIVPLGWNAHTMNRCRIEGCTKTAIYRSTSFSLRS